MKYIAQLTTAVEEASATIELLAVESLPLGRRETFYTHISRITTESSTIFDNAPNEIMLSNDDFYVILPNVTQLPHNDSDFSHTPTYIRVLMSDIISYPNTFETLGYVKTINDKLLRIEEAERYIDNFYDAGHSVSLWVDRDWLNDCIREMIYFTEEDAWVWRSDIAMTNDYYICSHCNELHSHLNTCPNDIVYYTPQLNDDDGTTESNYDSNWNSEDDDNDSENESVNAGYHCASRMWHNDAHSSEFRMGLEIEKEDETMKYEVFHDELYKKTQWIKEHDSSLNSETGYELISPVLPLSVKTLKQELKVQELVNLINANQSIKCGGHIHISAKEMSPLSLFDMIEGYTPLLYALYPKRTNRGYSMGKKLNDIKTSSANHSSAISISSNTVEYRIFPSPRNTSILLWRVALLELITKYPLRLNELEKQMKDFEGHLFKHLVKVYNTPDKYNKLYKRTVDMAHTYESHRMSTLMTSSTTPSNMAGEYAFGEETGEEDDE